MSKKRTYGNRIDDDRIVELLGVTLDGLKANDRRIVESIHGMAEGDLEERIVDVEGVALALAGKHQIILFQDMTLDDSSGCLDPVRDCAELHDMALSERVTVTDPDMISGFASLSWYKSRTLLAEAASQ